MAKTVGEVPNAENYSGCKRDSWGTFSKLHESLEDQCGYCDHGNGMGIINCLFD